MPVKRLNKKTTARASKTSGKTRPMASKLTSVVKSLEKAYKSSANQDKAVGMKKYMRDQFEYYGKTFVSCTFLLLYLSISLYIALYSYVKWKKVLANAILNDWFSLCYCGLRYFAVIECRPRTSKQNFLLQ